MPPAMLPTRHQAHNTRVTTHNNKSTRHLQDEGLSGRDQSASTAGRPSSSWATRATRCLDALWAVVDNTNKYNQALIINLGLGHFSSAHLPAYDVCMCVAIPFIYPCNPSTNSNQPCSREYSIADNLKSRLSNPLFINVLIYSYLYTYTYIKYISTPIQVEYINILTEPGKKDKNKAIFHVLSKTES
jgi:hypothetical protein